MTAIQPNSTGPLVYRVGDSRFVAGSTDGHWRIHQIDPTGVRLVYDLAGPDWPAEEFRRVIAHELLESRECAASLVSGEIELVVFRDPVHGAHLVGDGEAYEGLLRYFPTVEEALRRWRFHSRAILDSAPEGGA